MTLREKLGRLVLLEETEAGPLGREYRAARLGPGGLERLVSVQRFSPVVSAHPEATRRLMEEARVVARLHNPGLVRVLGVGRTDQVFYVSTEIIEGRTLATIFEKCRRDSFPFAADQALMVASRAASALEYVHGKKDETGRRLFHGLLTPARLIVTYHGEVKIKGLGLWTSLHGTDLIGPDDRLHLAPEQAAGEEGDQASDVYALGLILLEALTGVAPDGDDPARRLLPSAETGSSAGRGSLPEPLAELLRRALTPEPSARFPGMTELRKAIDALLFSGDFAPTTFDLAFFMHTLFREEMDREAAALDEARRADYGEFIGGESPAPLTPPPTPPPASTEPDVPASPKSPATPGSGAYPPARVEQGRRVEPDPLAAEPTPPEVQPSRDTPPRPSRDTTRQAAARLTLGRTAQPARDRRLLWLVVGLLAAFGVGGTAGGLYFVKLRSSATTPPATLDAEAAAAQTRVRELEARVAELEREKAEAENKAAEGARIDLERQAAAGGRAPDPAAVAVAQEEARRRAREEQEAKQRDERRRLVAARKTEEERLAASAARPPTPAPAAYSPPPAPTPSDTPTLVSQPLPVSTLAESIPTPPPTPALQQAPEPTPAPALALDPTPAPTPTPSTVVAQAAPAVEAQASPKPALVSPGELVDVNDPALSPPMVVDQTPLRYPPIAQQRLIEGTVELRVLIDEKGVVRQVTLVRVSPRGAGFEGEAARHAKTRRYRPATKGGVPVRVWLPIVVNFRNPKG